MAQPAVGAVSAEIDWIKSNYDNFPNFQTYMNDILRNPDEYRLQCMSLIHLKQLLPFTPKKLNNIPENSIFWTCVEKLKNAADENLQLIGNGIEDGIRNARTVFNQLEIVFLWLNLFGYYSDDMTRIERIRSNFSDARHAEYGIACEAILTSDKRFAKRVCGAIGALELTTAVCTDANELLQRIADRAGSR